MKNDVRLYIVKLFGGSYFDFLKDDRAVSKTRNGVTGNDVTA